MKVLIVTADFDQKLAFYAMRRMIEDSGFDLEVVRNGDEAVLTLNQEPDAFSAVFLDGEFKDRIEGPAYLDMIRRINVYVPVIAIAESVEVNKAMAKRRGKGLRLCQGYINKGDWVNKKKEKKIEKIFKMVREA